MTAEDPGDAARKSNSYHFDRHAADYRGRFAEVTKELHSRCPVAWSDTYDGHWVVSGYQEVFDIARRADILSNDHDPHGERRGYQGISIPQNSPGREPRRGHPPSHRPQWTVPDAGKPGRELNGKDPCPRGVHDLSR